MKKKGLRSTSHNVPKTNRSIWWYEDRNGIEIVISDAFIAGGRAQVVKISRRALEGYFKRLRSLRRT